MSVSIETLRAVCLEAGLNPNRVVGFQVDFNAGRPVVRFEVLSIATDGGPYIKADDSDAQTHEFAAAVTW